MAGESDTCYINLSRKLLGRQHLMISMLFLPLNSGKVDQYSHAILHEKLQLRHLSIEHSEIAVSRSITVIPYKGH